MWTLFNPVQHAVWRKPGLFRSAERKTLALFATFLLLVAVFVDGTAAAFAAQQHGGAPDAVAASSLGIIEGFRSARFGMSEEQLRRAIERDFPGPAAGLRSSRHQTEKTTVLSLVVPELLPEAGNARLFYVLGYRTKKLIQVNIFWISGGTAESNKIVVGAANTLRQYFAAQGYAPDTIIANRKLSEDALLVFRASDRQGRSVLLTLSGAGSEARRRGRPPSPPPLTLELSYAADIAHPDVFNRRKSRL